MLEYQYKAEASKRPPSNAFHRWGKIPTNRSIFSSSRLSAGLAAFSTDVTPGVAAFVQSVWVIQFTHYFFLAGTFLTNFIWQALLNKPFLAGTVLALSIERDVSGLKVPPDRVKKLWEIFQKKDLFMVRLRGFPEHYLQHQPELQQIRANLR